MPAESSGSTTGAACSGSPTMRQAPATSPKGVCRCQAVAGTNGRSYAIALYLTPIPALWLAVPIAAVLSGAALWGIRRFVKPRYSFPTVLSRRHLIMLGQPSPRHSMRTAAGSVNS